MSGARYPAGVLQAIARLAEADPEREICGLVVRRGDGSVEAVPVANVAGRPAGPGSPARSARESYVMDPHQQLVAMRDLARTGGRVIAVYHSHVDGGVDLSARDREEALIGGTPVVPGAEYLVVAVRGGKVVGSGRYAFDGRGFVREPLN